MGGYFSNHYSAESKDPRVQAFIKAYGAKYAGKTPDAMAVIFQEQRLSYAELNARANQLARHLRSLGVGPEVLVGVCIERSLRMLVGLLGVLKAGGAYLPLSPTDPSARLRNGDVFIDRAATPPWKGGDCHMNVWLRLSRVVSLWLFHFQ